MVNFCCNCGEGTRDGVCVNCQFLLCVLCLWRIFVLLCLLGFVDVSAGWVIDVDFNDNSQIVEYVIHRGEGWKVESDLTYLLFRHVLEHPKGHN